MPHAVPGPVIDPIVAPPAADMMGRKFTIECHGKDEFFDNDNSISSDNNDSKNPTNDEDLFKKGLNAEKEDAKRKDEIIHRLRVVHSQRGVF